MGTTWGNVIWAGFAAGVLAACVFWLFRSFEWTSFSPATFLGCLFTGNPQLPLTETVGLVLFLGLGSTVLAALHAWLMYLLGGAGWGTGTLVGVLHGAAVVGAMPWLGRVNRCVRARRLLPPGRFGLGWGRLTPLAVVVGYTVYGAVLGAILGVA